MSDDISIRNSNVKVCEILGLNPAHVESLEIRLAHDTVPTAYVQMAVTESQIFEISTMSGVVKKFKGN